MYAAAIVSTLAAWGVGLLLDANIDFGDPQAFCACGCCCPSWPWESACCGDQRAEGQRGQMNPRPEAAI